MERNGNIGHRFGCERLAGSYSNCSFVGSLEICFDDGGCRLMSVFHISFPLGTNKRKRIFWRGT